MKRWNKNSVSLKKYIIWAACLVSFFIPLACTQLYAEKPISSPSSNHAVPSGSHHEVVITDGAYQPAEITIQQGDTVTWTNEGTDRYTVTSWYTFYDEDFTAHVMIGRTWDSGDIFPGESFSRTFDRSGVYEYFSFPLLESPGFPLTPYLVPAIENGKITIR